MVAQQEAIVGENSVVVVSHQQNYHKQLVNKNMMMIKGKRTKRQRPLSPLALTMSSATTTTDEGGSAMSEDWTAHNSAPAPSSEEEEQDMAHCLILLAQGTNQNNNNNSNNSNSVPALNNIKGSNLISCYECKTCNKTFSSFQALGGHRASHKKPRPNNIAALSELKKSSPVLFSLLNHHDNHHHDDGTTLSLQIANSTLSTTNNNANNNNNNNTNNSNNNNNKTKVHECGICGAEFSSGQALGGHMRRHRPIAMATSTASNPSENSVALINAIPKDNNNNVKDEKASRNLLSLDLNLPAPDDEHHQQQQQRESSSKFVFSSNEKTLVFAAASTQLVDCPY